MFPKIDEFLSDMEEEADTLEERFNMNALLRTPVNLKYHSTYDDRPFNPWEYPDCPFPSDLPYDMYEDFWRANCKEPTVVERVEEQFITWGFDPVIVNSWLSDTTASWETLKQEQEIAEAQLAMSNVQEAADYAKGILDNAMADWV